MGSNFKAAFTCIGLTTILGVVVRYYGLESIGLTTILGVVVRYYGLESIGLTTIFGVVVRYYGLESIGLTTLFGVVVRYDGLESIGPTTILGGVVRYYGLESIGLTTLFWGSSEIPYIVYRAHYHFCVIGIRLFSSCSLRITSQIYITQTLKFQKPKKLRFGAQIPLGKQTLFRHFRQV